MPFVNTRRAETGAAYQRVSAGTRNAALLARSVAAVWHPCTQMKQLETLPLVPIARGSGVWLYDFDGRRYLDAISSWWVNLFGHGNPRINAALIAQLGDLEHVMLAGFTHEPVVELSERLRALTDDKLGHCFYGSDGASAVEIALKMSFHFWRNNGRPEKTGFVSLVNSYHGETLGALSVTDVAIFRDAYSPLLLKNTLVPSPDWRLAEPGESPRAYAERCAQALQRHLEEHHAHTAALIVEPLVQGATGMAMYDAEYLRRARALCDRFEVHLIADEIMTGCGRTGTFFAHEQAEITPDFSVPVERHHRRLPAAVGSADDGQGLCGVLRRQRRARFSAFAFLYRQRARLPRRAGDARYLCTR